VRQRARSLLWRAGQLLLIALPVALLGLAGAMYLWQVKLAVEESLPPALRDYARRQAQLDVQVERVSLGWNRILLTYPEVRTLSGERLLRARYLEVRLPADGRAADHRVRPPRSVAAAGSARRVEHRPAAAPAAPA
jgi:hypothetical protein